MFKKNDNTPIGMTNGRNPRLFGMQQSDRRFHLYTIGRSGSGKTTLLYNICQSDLRAKRGFILIDPHGDLADTVYASIPDPEKDNVIYLNTPDPTQPYGYNPLRHVRSDKQPLAASGVLEVFQKLWSDAWGQRMEHILRNALLAILEQPEGTLEDITRLLRNKDYRQKAVATLKNEKVRDFWRYEYEKYSYRLRADGIVPIQNKIGAFLTDPMLCRILTRPKTPLSFRKLMDEGKVVVVNLSKGRIGSDSANLLGALLVTTIGLAAYSRADTPEVNRQDYSLIIDEFQNFTTKSIADMTSELRKFHINLILANQYLSQVDTEVRDAVLANMGTLVSFRVGPFDSQKIAHEFSPKITPTDLLNLPNYHVYMKLMINGAPSKPFSAETLPPKNGIF